mmetsp:Transcript_8828/g.16156  ORF Transcript_8828/g.16156 Transcript_8828/m.16156 type:complete len:100 (+) Transcript_8828:215-514(+)
MDNQPTVKNLEAELKLLRWHKLANESALKAAILKDKQTKRSDIDRIPRLLNNSNVRLSAVIEDERSKDLIVRESCCIFSFMLRLDNITYYRIVVLQTDR